MRAVLALLIMCGTMSVSLDRVSAGDNPFAKEWEFYRALLTEPACGGVADQKKCETVLDSWRRDFRWAIDPYWKAQYQGQRNIAFCFAEGCSGEVKIHPRLACAWAKVVLLSGHPEITDSDIEAERNVCSALPTKTDRETAEAQAKRILQMIAER